MPVPTDYGVAQQPWACYLLSTVTSQDSRHGVAREMNHSAWLLGPALLYGCLGVGHAHLPCNGAGNPPSGQQAGICSGLWDRQLAWLPDARVPMATSTSWSGTVLGHLPTITSPYPGPVDTF